MSVTPWVKHSLATPPPSGTFRVLDGPRYIKREVKREVKRESSEERAQKRELRRENNNN